MKTINHLDLKLQKLSFQQNFLDFLIPRFIFECFEYQPKITGNHTTSPQYTSAQSVCDTLLSEPYYKTDYNNYYQSDYYHYQQLSDFQSYRCSSPAQRWFSVGICISSHWLKLQHSDWRANIVKDFF